jgi:hypothetical protein
MLFEKLTMPRGQMRHGSDIQMDKKKVNTQKKEV